ncbi:MAG: glycoside hydrolase family 16 protein [Treponema sp.]|nr:glycoside hydrolase family 16 protein [Treponema sp.]
MAGACASNMMLVAHDEPFVTGGTLVWSDEFDGDSLDLTKWNIDTGTGAQYGLTGWGNNELQFYRPENVVVKDGILYLESRKDNADYDKRDTAGGVVFTSGKITTGGNLSHDGLTTGTQKFVALPGDRVEARIRSTRGVGFWPAFWLIGATTNKYGDTKKVYGWPRAGEIDVLEIRGGQENQLMSTVHFGPYWPLNRADGKSQKIDINLADDFHVYGVTWDSKFMHFLFDGEIWYSIDMQQLHDDNGKEFYVKEAFNAKTGFVINLNLAIAGAFSGGKTPDDSVFEDDAPYEDRCFMVDWIRVYRK